MKKVFFLLSLSLFFQALSAQKSAQTTIKFDAESFDFGNLKINSRTSHVFYFTNTGTHPLKILKVTASCGCTTPQWDSLPIAPGKSGKITVLFEAFPLEKSFNKTITVESNTDPAIHYLEINGYCVDIYKAQKERYKQPIGRLLFENTHIDFDKIYSNITLTQKSMYFYNNSEDTIKVDGFVTPEHLLCAASPDVILPHAEGIILVNYNANRIADFGFKLDRIQMLTNDKDYPKKTLVISADIMEYFDTTINNNAILFLKEKKFEFGKVKPGEIKSHIFELKNSGTDTLFIRKIRTTCGCTESVLSSDKIAPGKTATLKISYNTSGAIPGINNKPVVIISSDRKNPVVNIGVSVVVE